jgi:hypothetical protein
MSGAEAPIVGGYLVEGGQNDVWFLVDPETGRHRGTFFPVGAGRWKGLPPVGNVAEYHVGDVEDPHIVMARRLTEM